MWWKLKAYLFAILTLALFTCCSIIDHLKRRPRHSNLQPKTANTCYGSLNELNNALNTMTNFPPSGRRGPHHLPPPTEHEIQAEIIAFHEAAMQYHKALQLRIDKMNGGVPFLSIETIDWAIARYFLNAYEHIPTLWLVELHEMLSELKIQNYERDTHTF